jgi:hypothetical protein
MSFATSPTPRPALQLKTDELIEIHECCMRHIIPHGRMQDGPHLAQCNRQLPKTACSPSVDFKRVGWARRMVAHCDPDHTLAALSFPRHREKENRHE